jgi:hypothetical protein
LSGKAKTGNEERSQNKEITKKEVYMSNHRINTQDRPVIILEYRYTLNEYIEEDSKDLYSQGYILDSSSIYSNNTHYLVSLIFKKKEY